MEYNINTKKLIVFIFRRKKRENILFLIVIIINNNNKMFWINLLRNVQNFNRYFKNMKNIQNN